MVKRAQDPVAFRQSLLELLEANPPNEERLLRELERRTGEGASFYSSIIHILTHLAFSESEARKHWRLIQTHRDQLQMELRRDVGMRVAMLDYFVNVNKELKNPKVIELSIYQRTEHSAVSDGLTGLYNHAYMLQTLRREIQRSRRHELKLSLVMLDLDDFKKLNDTRGHLEGDKVLMKAAALVKESLREIDTAARYGGEEFSVILPETARAGAFIVAERVRARIEEYFRKRRGGPRVTVSGGVASFPDDAGSVEDLIRRADEGLYRSKAGGKNRITLMEGERRRHRRVAVSRKATLEARGVEQAAVITRNVSDGGLLVSLKNAVPVGSHVTLVIRSGSNSVGLRGEVVRVDAVAGPEPHYDVGVRLVESGSEDTRVLRRLAAPAAQA
jgi:diguanylate cyclase (GGDEF)-like protein